MPKVKISEFSSTPGSNTDIDGINIAEGCAPSGINDAIRELMAQLKDFQTGAVGDSFNGPVGTSTAAAGAFTTLSASSTVSGTGFSTYLASPPAIGGTAAAAGAFTTLSATGVTTVQAGSAGAPAITTSGDTNTGIFFPAADTIAATVGGSEQMRLTSTGLGIGTSSPSSGSNPGKLAVQSTQDFGISIYRTATSPSQIAFLDNNNSCAIGTDGNSNMVFLNNSRTTERMRLDSSGNLLVGTTNVNGVGWTLNPNGSGQIRSSGTGSEDKIQFANGNGVVGAITTNGTATAYNTTSDQRLKENIQDAAPASALIDNLQVRQYDWKSNGSHQRYGFVAQELLTIAPEAVHQPADPEAMMAVDYSKLVPMLVKEIQSLRARVASLESD
jgi:hypothetical protein